MLITKGSTYVLAAGDHFTLVLPDGTAFNVEQTADDFSMAHADGHVAYTTPTSSHAKREDSDIPRATGRK